jgi:hypothetical protein
VTHSAESESLDTESKEPEMDVVDRINDGVDQLVRRGENAQTRLEIATDAGFVLAQAVYEFTEDPDGVGTDALRTAYDTFMGLHAGNFHA